MTPDRIRDARRLLGQIPAAEWIDLYARDLVTALESRALGLEARGTIAAMAAAGGVLGKSCSEALREFETTLGGGDRDGGRKLLTERSGTLQPTQVRMAAAARLYAAVRLYVLRWTAAGATKDELLRAHNAIVAEGTPPAPSPKGGRPLAALLDALEGIKLPDATPEQRENVRRAIQGFREQGAALGMLDPEPAAPSEPPAPDEPSEPRSPTDPDVH